MYKSTEIKATDTNPSMFKVEFTTEYSNTLAQAASVASGFAAEIRALLQSMTVNGVAEEAVFSGANAEYVVDGWTELETADDKAAMASFKAGMARVIRSELGFGAKVVGGKLVGTKIGAGKSKTEADSDSVQALKLFEKAATPKQIAEMNKLITGAIEIYAKTEGLTIGEAKAA